MKLACITLDMEVDYTDPSGRIQLLENTNIRTQYIALLKKYNVKTTIFTVTSLIHKYGHILKGMQRMTPIEFAVHSHTHDPQNACSLDEITQATRAFRTFTGSNPLGYRAPRGKITHEGMRYLMDSHYLYDSSMYPSIRPGKYGYNNLHMPNYPYRVQRGNQSLIELPFTCVSTVRIPFALSYVKLFGVNTYNALLEVFGLPEQVVMLMHPYDLYTHSVDHKLRGAEKFALLRNSQSAFSIFEYMIAYLSHHGYSFVFMSDLAQNIKNSATPTFTIK